MATVISKKPRWNETYTDLDDRYDPKQNTRWNTRGRNIQDVTQALEESLLVTGSRKIAAKFTKKWLETNALFEFDNDGTYQATVTVEGGVRYLSGIDAERVPNEAEAVCKALNNQVIRAFEALPPSDALKTIETIWNMAEQTCELAAARSRLLLGRMPKVPTGDLPCWFENGIKALDKEDNEALNPASLQAARRIVKSSAARFPKLEARVSVGLLGRITLDWYCEGTRCSWMVDPTDMPFPAVRIYEARQHQGHEIKTIVIHDMHNALNALQELIDKSNGE